VGIHRWLFPFWINDRLIVSRVFVVPNPKLESKLLGAIPHGDLIDARLMAGPKSEMDRPVRSHDQVFRSRDDVTAVQSFDCYRLTGLYRRISDADIDGLVMAQANPIKTARMRRDGDDLVIAQINRRRRFTGTVSRFLSAGRRCWRAVGDQVSVCLKGSLRQKRFRFYQQTNAGDRRDE